MSGIKFEKNIVLDEEISPHIKTGTLFIRCSENVNVSSISIVIGFSARGKMSSQSKRLAAYEICRNETFVTGMVHEIPFSIPLDASYRDSYLGKSVNFSYYCQVEIDVIDQDIAKIDRGAFEKIKSFITSDDTIKGTRSFDLDRGKSRYEVVQKTSHFKLETNIYLIAIGIIGVGGLSTLVALTFSPWLFIPGYVITVLFLFLPQELLSTKLGNVAMVTTGNENTFYCKIIKKGTFNLTNQKLHYRVIEEVVDRRGTSSKTYTSNLYVSKEHNLDDRNKEILQSSESSFEFYYPEQAGLESYHFNDARVFWEMYLSGNFFGLPLEYSAVFNVKRELSE